MTCTIDWDVTDARWEAFLATCPDANFFHTPGWYRVWEDVAGFKPSPALLTFDDGTQALLPLAIAPKFRGLVREAHSGLGAAYGGLVSPRLLTPAQAEAAYAAVRRRFPDLQVTGNPHATGPHLPEGGHQPGDDTLVAPVMPDAAAQRAIMTKSRVSSLKAADKVGYTLETVTNPAEADVDRFYALYEAHSGKWAYKRWRQDAGYFRALFRRCGPDLVLFLVHHEGELAGFRIMCTRGPIVMALHLARAEAYEKKQVSPWMVERSFDWCRAQGYRWLDFQPSGRLEGVRAYKASWGSEARPYATASFQGAVGGALTALWKLARKPEAA